LFHFLILSSGFIREHDVKSPGGDRYKAASGDKPLSAMATPQERIQKEPVFENIYNCCQNIAKKRRNILFKF
jgi:hypothetical protein